MSLLKTTLPNGVVRDATVEEEDRFIAAVGEDNPLAKRIMEERQGGEAAPARKPSGEPSRSRNRKGAKAPEGE